MEQGQEDATLWRDALAGDGRAFGLLFDRHYSRVFRHAVPLVEQPADADEVAAAAFLELWRRRPDVRVVGGSLLPWLLVTAGNLARNEGRRARRYRRLIEDLLQGVPSADPDPGDTVAAWRDTLGALRRVPAADAELILLAAELPLDDVAAALGIAPGAARVRLHRARRRLRLVVDGDGAGALVEGRP